jgi:hypothetical protein
MPLLYPAELERLLADARYTSVRVIAVVDGAGEIEMDFPPGRLQFTADREYDDPPVDDQPVDILGPIGRVVIRLEIRPDNRLTEPVATVRQVQR